MNRTKSKLKIHPACAASPTMSPDRFEEFKADIEAKGLVCPIILHKGKILDGRHRQIACDQLGIEAEYLTDDELIETGGDAWAFVWSTMMRKNHSKSQLTIFAAEWKQAAGKQRSGPKKKDEAIAGEIPRNRQTRDLAGSKFGVSGREVSRAKNVLEKGCRQLQQAVRDDRIPVSLAEKVATSLGEEEQQEIVAVAMASEKPARALREALPKKKKPKFDETDESILINNWVRNRLDNCPERFRPTIISFLRSMLKEFN